MKNNRKHSKYIVGIGASAGGLEAIHEFFDNMPASSSFAFVIIQHLSTDYKSLLVELVSKHTHMKVFEAEENMTIQQDCVYIIPNDKLMTVSGGQLKLSTRGDRKSPNTAIDTFYRSLAKDQKENAIAIILSGTGSDGTKGIEAIKEFGGMVIVQEPGSAKFDGMPNSAIASGNADLVQVPGDMPAALFEFINQAPAAVISESTMEEGQLEEIFQLVNRENGHDFNLYKTPTIIRRITRRMTERKVSTLSEYIQVLQNDNNEIKLLGNDFLIGVTRFFRDKPAFDLLESSIIPDIISSKADGSVVKVWVCACSTGEEAYSVAVLLNQALEASGKNIEIKIFATDVDSASLDIASANRYPLAIADNVPPHLLKKYFVREHKHYSVIPEIRKQIVFAKHDVIKSPPFIKNDLITCRNMLIYMNSVLQHKVLSTFHFSLNADGYLFLGTSETGTVLKEGFSEVNGKWKIYRKAGKLSYSALSNYQVEQRQTPKLVRRSPDEEKSSFVENDFKTFLINELGYAGIYIDANYVIREVVGNYRKFLSLPEGQIELNILKMMPKPIAVKLNTAIRQAAKESRTIHIHNLKMEIAGEDKLLSIRVRKPQTEGLNAYTLLVFSESHSEIVHIDPLRDIPSDSRHDEVVLELEAELSETKVNLQMAIEEMETTNEELQSSNEELLSANEELQSSNEELQSLNEELHTLNTEHQLKIKELVELNDDLDNYFKAVDIGFIFLTPDLVIRKFNPAVVRMVNLIDADVGRSFDHISNNILNENLVADIHAVLSNGQLIEKDVILRTGMRCLMRIMPYVRKDKVQDGVIISFVDVTALTELSNIVNGVFNASSSGIFAFSAVRNRNGRVIDFKCIAGNQSAAELLQLNKEQLEHASLQQDLTELVQDDLFNRYLEVVNQGDEYRFEILIHEKWYQAVAVKMADGMVINLTDTTATKKAEQKLRMNYNELVETRETLRTLNTELESRISERTRELSESEERFKLVSTATNDTIWDWDLASNTVWRNENFNIMFGYELNQETSTTDFWFNKVHPDDRERVKKSIFNCINKKYDQWSEQYRFLKGDDSYAYVLDRGRILKDEYKTPYRVVGSTIDITQLIETEQQLVLSHNKFRKIFETNVIGMTFASLSTGRIHEANYAFISMLGYLPEEFENSEKSLSDITPQLNSRSTGDALKEIRKTLNAVPREMKYIRKDGETIWVLAGSAVLDETDGDEIVTFMIDITQQKESERKRNDLQNLIIKQQDQFYSIFKEAPALISIRTGPELRYQFVNEAFRKFDGKNEYLGLTAAEAGSIFHNSEIHKFSFEVLRTGKSHTSKSFKIVRETAANAMDTSWYDFTITPVYSDEGEIEGVAFFGFEVTDLVLGKNAVQHLMQQKDEFLSIASHELKTPITSIKLSLQIAERLIKAGKTDANLVQFLSKARRQGDKLQDLVRDLLDVTKIQAGKMMFNFSNFAVNELIDQCVADVGDHNPTHEIRVLENPSIQLSADMNRIEQVMINFLSNAVKYSPDNMIVDVTSEIRGKMFRFSVRDYGIGIPKDKQEQIFTRFYRVQESSVKFSGLGLGLYISAEIIRRHLGVIGVESEENAGSTFWFEIPLER